jgi:hypothetical protein
MGRSFNQTELELRSRPVKGERAPGVPTPREPRRPVSDSMAATSPAMASRVAR